ncbi:MAG: hypothetical protein NT166_15010 [Candidatus Aminicenantes bacterium]|nr:hypothetical protein [Candidatus Aminicenantes bacterium]
MTIRSMFLPQGVAAFARTHVLIIVKEHAENLVRAIGMPIARISRVSKLKSNFKDRFISDSFREIVPDAGK